MADRLLVVGCGAPQVGLVRFARAMGLRVIGADMNPRALGAADCSELVVASTADVDAVVAAARATGAEGVTSCGSEVAVRTACAVAHRLGMPFYCDEATLDRCQDKEQMRAAYASGGAPIPAFAAVTNLAEARAFVAAHGLPAILKPARGWGQRGVGKVTREDELAPQFEASQAASSSGVVLVESFLEGREYSVNAYTLAGETTVYSVTERVITEYPQPPGITFAEWYPSGLAAEDEAKVRGAALAAVRALGIVRGPSYHQIRSGPKGAFLVETAHRLGGGLDPDVAFLASGVSLYRKLVGVALSRPEDEARGVEAEPRGGAIGHFLIGEPGTIGAIEGVDEARRMPGIASAEVWLPVGGVVHPLTDGSKRAGHVLAWGRDRDEAKARALAAERAIRIVTERA